MPNVTLRDVPSELHSWLKQRAACSHRSVNKEVISLLEEVRGRADPPLARVTAQDIMEISRRAAALAIQDRRSDDEILGYGDNGLPN